MPVHRPLLVALFTVTTGCSGVAASIDDSAGDDTQSPPGAGTRQPATTDALADGGNGEAGTAGGSRDSGLDATTVTTGSDGGNGGASGDASITPDATTGADASADAAPDATSTPKCTGLPDPSTAPQSLDTSCFTSSFADDFSVYDISSGPTADGQHADERWFNGTDECCMDPSNGWPGVMYPTPSQATNKAVNPYSLLPGGGLQISLSQANDEWFSGVMTTVDANENGFSQQYGYFEMTTQLPPGTGTWPSFWMLSLPRSAPGGEIDIFEQLGCNPPLDPAVEKIFHYTLHDWKGGTTPYAYTASNLPDLTAAYHRYGLLWNKTYMALYFDGQLLASSPTPSVMIGVKYFLLADLGIGAGWVTTDTPNPSNMLVKSINAWTVPGF